MLPTVEALSLSAFTELAEQPPLDPTESHQSLPGSLMLYIARVPGSRDVFLTPIKPREKVVTAEDIQSSLYFLHIHVPEDERIMDEKPEGQRLHQPPPLPPHRISPQTGLHPLSGNPSENIQSSNHPLPLIPGVKHVEQPPVSNVKRKPVGGAKPPLNAWQNVQSQHNVQAGLHSPSQQQQDAPPYPQQDVFPNVENWIPRKNRSPLRNEVSDSEFPPKLPRSDHRGSSPLLGTRSSSFSSSTVQMESHFTLIRRDPATGEQWNVASISSHPNKKSLNANGTSFENSTPRIEVILESPGYSKFSHPTTLNASNADLSISSEGSGCLNKFHRELRMEDSKFQDTKPGHLKALSHDSIELDSRRGSEDFAASNLSLVSSAPSQPKRIPRKSIRKTGYTFLSPWNGRCEFSTTLGNSTLKCKHSLGPTVLSSEPPPPSQVSELRFNLPGSSQAAPTNNLSQSLPRRSKLFGRKKNADASELSPDYLRRSSEPNVSASILDLSLGQERAGGGFGGKQAKLGKLIIEKEGLKMLDLLVAANMSLWWKAYEKG